MSYVAPIKDMLFCMKELAGLEEVARMPGFEDAGLDTAQAVLEECAKLNEGVIAPLNWEGDKYPSSWHDGKVTTTPGFKEAFREYAEGGWQGLQHPADFGGQGLPKTIGAACGEMLNSANLSFALCPLLTDGAIEALLTAGTPEQQATFIPKMISGEWTGTMNLTEPQAGSDLSLVRTKAVPQADGTFRLTGEKIFITYGDQDYTENIVHLVLARIEGAPEGVKGISLFVVPKVNVNADGSLGERNAVKCASIEHKMGIHASPTAVMVYEGATGHLVGEANRGLEYMFVMMNAARLGVGLEGVSICERAFQRALGWSRERLQGRPVGVAGAARTAPIIQHPDVKRMLLTMKSSAEATRALAYLVSSLLDRARRHPDEAERRRCQSLVDLLIPVVKGWSTELGIEVASLGVQVHGGMGFIEETGAAQHLRDARIATIYEGTTGIQANDLVGRKVGREGGSTARLLAADMRRILPDLAGSPEADLKAIGQRLEKAIGEFERAMEWIVLTYPADPGAVAAGSVAFLKLSGFTIGGWMMARSALVAARQAAAGEGDPQFLRGKRLTARFFADQLMPQVDSLAEVVTNGAASVLAAEDSLI